jgi:shikimate dehydrogenase
MEYTFVSRTPKAGQLAYTALNRDVLNEYKVIVNASPVGTFPNVGEAPAIPYRYLTPEHLLFDLVYNPSETKFLQSGRAQGAKTKNGAEMFDLQALAAWNIWNG